MWYFSTEKSWASHALHCIDVLTLSPQQTMISQLAVTSGGGGECAYRPGGTYIHLWARGSTSAMNTNSPPHSFYLRALICPSRRKYSVLRITTYPDSFTKGTKQWKDTSLHTRANLTWVGEMVPLAKGLAIKSEDCVWSLELTGWKERTDSRKLFSNLHTHNMVFVYLNTQHINVELKTKIPAPRGEVFMKFQLSEERPIINSYLKRKK